MSRIAKAAALTAAVGAALAAGAGVASADADAQSAAVGSPGVASGNILQLPVHVPVNLCGDTIDAAALLNPAFGTECVNSSDHEVTPPPAPAPAPSAYGSDYGSGDSSAS